MYHDLLAFAPGASFVTPLLTHANLDIEWAATEWKLSPSVKFVWPTPPCATFFDFDCFKSAWNDVIRDPNVVQATGQEYVIERLVFAWLTIGLAVMRKEPLLSTKSWNDPQWEDLIAGMEPQHDHESTEAGKYTEWLRRVAELLMPEMGLPGRVIDRFARAGQLKQVWVADRLTLRQRRLERLRTVFAVDPDFAEHLRTTAFLSELAPERKDLAGTPET
jgi:hypothetical protein